MGLSRNKVAVPEGAAGSPPFYGEFSPMFFGQCVPHDGVTVMPYSVDAGVEEIMGLDVPSGCPEVVWVCFWAPGPPPHNVCCGAVRCPSSSAWFPLLVSGEGGGAWWFENWIVDASKRN